MTAFSDETGRERKRDAYIGVLASLAAAISLLERTPRSKKAASSDKMFDQMIVDYKKALDEGRAALSASPVAQEPVATTLTRDDLLVLLVEECGEVIQAATKCLRFGYDADHGLGYGKNDVVLSRECGDLQAIMDALPLDRDAKALTQAAKIAKAETAKARYSPPATSAGLGADEIRSACIEHASLNMTVEAAHQQADRITAAILALLSRGAGLDQQRPHEEKSTQNI